VSFDPLQTLANREKTLAMRWGSFFAACVLLAGCSKGTACYGLSDRGVLSSIQRAYANHGQMSPDMARNFRLDRERVLGVERFGKEGEGAFVGMVFRQDDGRVLSIRLFEDCTYQASPAEKADLKNWAYPLAKPSF
jgi:hypothetical protein